jgi:glycosyltransferase involved in cell wall biosynthesis
MKVLHVINTLSAGGAELHLLTLSRHLKRWGVEVMVACLREGVKDSRLLRADFEKEDISVVALSGEGRYQVRFAAELVHLLKEERPAILHTHLPRADLAGAVGHFLYPSVPWVCSIHGVYEKSWAGRWTLPLFDFIWSRADVAIAISYAVKDWLVRKRRVPANKVTVIHYGIEQDLFSRASDDVRNAWAPDGQVIVGSIGRLEPGKGHDDCLIRAMPTILEKVPNCSLLIAGHDPWGYGRTLHATISDLGLCAQVQLVGFQGDVATFLSGLDVFALATRSEGFGQVLIEAMAAGKPVVASKIPPLTEIIVDGETGLLVEPEKPEQFARAITWLLSHPEEAAQMGRQGQERVRTYFSIEREIAQTLSLYKTLIG